MVWRIQSTPVNETQTVDTSRPLPKTSSTSAAEIHDEIESIIEVSWTQSNDANVVVRYSFDEDIWVESPTVVLSRPPNASTWNPL